MRPADVAALRALRFTVAAAEAPDLFADAKAWRAANDGVMGGLSNSHAARVDDGLRFAGELRLENNGGFASIRRAFDTKAFARVDAEGLAMQVRGDGNRYRLRVYTRDARGDEQWFAYYAVFETRAGELTQSELRWPQFAAGLRGRAVPDAPPLRWRDVIGIGVMITRADHRHGRGVFTLDLLRIEPLAP